MEIDTGKGKDKIIMDIKNETTFQFKMNNVEELEISKLDDNFIYSGTYTNGLNKIIVDVNNITSGKEIDFDTNNVKLEKSTYLTLKGNVSIKLKQIGNEELDYDVNITADNLLKGLDIRNIITNTIINLNISKLNGDFGKNIQTDLTALQINVIANKSLKDINL